MKNPLIINKQDSENLNILHDLFKDHPKHFMKMLTSKNGKFKFLLGWIISKTPKLDDSYNVTTRVNWILTGRTDFPTCPTCGKQYGVGKNVKVVDGYADHCSGRCNQLDPNIIRKKEETSLLRYGTKHPQQSKYIKDKIERTNIEKYGNKCVLQNEDIKQKIKETNLKKYGYEYVTQVKEIRDKQQKTLEKTLMEKYGVSNISKIPEVRKKMSISVRKAFDERGDEIKDKRRKTMIDRYGSYHISKVESIRNKREETNLKRYGNKITFLSDKVREKIVKTCMEKYGVDNPFKSEEFREYMRQCCFEKYGVMSTFDLPEVREKIRKTNLELYGHLYGRPFRYEFESMRFDSSWELSFWIFHKDKNIEIERCKDSFDYTVNGITRKYYPDFKVDNHYVEIKGDQFFDENGNMVNPYDRSQDDIYKGKYECMVKNGVRIYRRDDILIFLDYIKETYGKKYLNKFKINH